MADRKYGTETMDSKGNVVAIHGCDMKVLHLPEKEPAGLDYWQAWVNGIQDDGLTRNDAIRNAYKRSHSK